MKTHTAMRGALALGVSVAWLLTGSATAPADEALRPEVVGLSIFKPNPKDQFGGSAVSGQKAGVGVHLRLILPDRILVKMAVDPKRPFSVTDDQGNLLSTAKDNLFLDMHTSISGDGHRCQWTVEAAKLPSAGATHFRVQGNLLLTWGANKKTVTGTVPLRKGQQFRIGQIPVTITQVGKPRPPVMFAQVTEAFQALTAEQDDFEWGVRLQTKHPDRFAAMRDLRFFTSDGRPIKSRWRGSGDVGIGMVALPIDPATGVSPDLGYYLEYELAVKVSEFQYQATCFQELKTGAVPVDIKIDLGL